jgi:hypothetical protein
VDAQTREGDDMKKTMICLLVAFSLLFLVACSKPNNSSDENGESTGIPSNASMSAGTGIPAEYKGRTIQECYSVSENAFEPTIENLITNSKGSVIGRVTALENTTLDTFGWTIIWVEVSQSYFSGIDAGQVVPVYTWGGYIPLVQKLGDSLEAHGSNMSEEELMDTVVYDCDDESELPVVGEQYFFFLVPGNELMQDGSFERFFGVFGQFRVSEDGGLFIRKAYPPEGDRTEEYTRSDLLPGY